MQLASVLMTIDGPYLACWAVAAWSWAAATRDDKRWAWPVCGLALAAGFLFKFTILLLLAGLALDWLRPRPGGRPRFTGVLVMVLVAALGLAPVLIWNAGHDWVTVRHLLAHLGFGADAGGGGHAWSYSPMWTLEFFGLQLAAAGPLIVLMIAGMVGLRRVGGVPRPLIAAALPVFLFYLLVTAFTRVEGNWTLGGFVTLCPIAGWMVVSARERAVTWLRLVWGASALVGLIALAALPLAPIVAKGPIIGPKVPLNRITGLRADAEQVQELIEHVRERDGGDPFVITGHYGGPANSPSTSRAIPRCTARPPRSGARPASTTSGPRPT